VLSRRAKADPSPTAPDEGLRGASVALSQKEFALLRALAAEPVRVFTKMY